MAEQTTYQVVIPDKAGAWHKSHARPFKTLDAAKRECAKHSEGRILALYPQAINWMEVAQPVTQ